MLPFRSCSLDRPRSLAPGSAPTLPPSAGTVSSCLVFHTLRLWTPPCTLLLVLALVALSLSPHSTTPDPRSHSAPRPGAARTTAPSLRPWILARTSSPVPRQLDPLYCTVIHDL
ncbi:hypothetical protein NQD34_015978 [Periophthalmus magnuspinnatus]|nr:hypothetical protein NQD34_015978 [Periophthalmus magnuspinnatus]